MMGDFTLGNTGGAQGAPGAVRAPVVDTGKAIAIQGVASLAGSIFGAIQGGKNQEAQVEAVAAKGGALGDFSEELVKLGDAVRQGVMSSEAARMRMGKTINSARSLNPALTTDFMKIRNEFLTTSGLGKVVGTGTEGEKFRRVQEKEAVDLGFVNPLSATVEQMDQAILMVAREKRSQADAKSARDELSAAQAQVNLTSSQLALAKSQAEAKGRSAMKVLSETRTYQFNNQMDEIERMVANGDIEKEEAIILANDKWNVINAEISNLGADAGAAYINNLASPMKSLLDQTVAGLDGSRELGLIKTQKELIIANASLEFLSDPRLLRAHVASSMVKNANLSTAIMSQAGVVEYMITGSTLSGKGIDVLPSTEEGKKNFKAYLQHTTDSMDKVLDGTAVEKEKTEREIVSQLTNMVKDIDAFSLTTDDVKDYNQFVTFLGTPTFGRFSEAKGGVPKDMAPKLKLVLQERYEQKVIPLLRQEFEKATITNLTESPRLIGMGITPSQTPAIDLLEPVFRDGGVQFVPKGGVVGDFNTLAKARTLNSTVSPVLNRLIRASAHVDAHRNYKRVYDENYGSIFGVEQEGGGATTQVRSRPKAGDIVDGFRFKADGLDPNDTNSWERVDG